MEKANLMEMTAAIVACFVSRNALAPVEVPALISSTYDALAAIHASRNHARAGRVPAVPVEQSITHDYLVCLDDGKKLRSLRRYLRRKYALSPEEYRARWQLPDDYPMVAPAYAELRSAIAKRSAANSSSARRASRQIPPSKLR